MKRLLAAAAVLSLGACGTTTTPINGPNGLAYEVDCYHAGHTLKECYNAAARQCKNGYRVLGVDTSSRGGMVTNHGYMMAAHNQSIVVECK